MPEEKPPEIVKAPRLVSLDALRGFDMFWILGGTPLVIALAKYFQLPEPWLEKLSVQMTHVAWEGFHFHDLIFPLFVFMSGVAVPYSIISKREKGTSATLLQWRIFRRSLVLVLIGLSFSVFKFQPDQIRLYTVLWLIGMSYLIGASITLHVKSWKARIVIFFVVLLAYHLAVLYMPFPGKEAEMTPNNNFAAWVDRNLIATNLYHGDYDPEGSIRVIPGGMLCLLGALVGERLRNLGKPGFRCGLEMIFGGLVCLALGWGWSFGFPIIKDLWSPSFIVWSSGWSLLLLASFYLVMDVWKQRWIGWVFLPIGMNAILIYASRQYVPWASIRDFFFHGYADTLDHPALQQVVLSGGLLLVQWLVLFWLYRKKQFISI